MGLAGKSFVRMAKDIQQISKITVMTVLLLGVALFLAACGGQGAAVKAKWIEAQLAGDVISIPVGAVNSNKIVHFKVPAAPGNDINFMAYDLDGQLIIRANVCPPCRSVGFSLKGDTLVCDTCATTFKAKTGAGIAGACVGYPKAAVPYAISDGKMVMQSNDLVLAYQNTNEPGLP